jgi:hypothetical protein
MLKPWKKIFSNKPPQRKIMKLLRSVVLGAQHRRDIVALENHINDMLDFAHALPVTTASVNMSLESIVSHLRPQPKQRFSFKDIAQEESDTGVLITVGIAIVAALAFAISKFLAWLFPSSQGGSIGSGGGASYASSSPSAKSDILVATENKNSGISDQWGSVGSNMRTHSALRVPKANSTKSGTAKPVYVPVRDIDDVVSEWLKTEGALNSRAGQFMTHTPPEYHDISIKGPWYTCVKDVKAVIRKMGEAMTDRAHQLAFIDKALTGLERDGSDTDKIVDEISTDFSHPLVLTVGSTRMSFNDMYGSLNSSYAVATSVQGHAYPLFSRMLRAMMPPGLLKHAAEIAESVEVANIGMEKIQPSLDSIDEHMKRLGGGAVSNDAVLAAVKKALEILRQDVFGYVRVTHQLMMFVDKVHKLNSDLIMAQTAIIDVIKSTVRDDEGNKPDGLDEAIASLKKAVSGA